MKKLLDLLKEKREEYSKKSNQSVSLTFDQKLKNKIEQLKSSSQLRENNYDNCIKFKTSIGSLYLENSKEKKDNFVVDELKEEKYRNNCKNISLKKLDKEFRKKQLRLIHGKGFNSQKIELLLEALSSDKIDKVFKFHDLFNKIFEYYIIRKLDLLIQEKRYEIDILIFHLISIEENRVLLN